MALGRVTSTCLRHSQFSWRTNLSSIWAHPNFNKYYDNATWLRTFVSLSCFVTSSITRHDSKCIIIRKCSQRYSYAKLPTVVELNIYILYLKSTIEPLSWSDTLFMKSSSQRSSQHHFLVYRLAKKLYYVVKHVTQSSLFTIITSLLERVLVLSVHSS